VCGAGCAHISILEIIIVAGQTFGVISTVHFIAARGTLSGATQAGQGVIFDLIARIATCDNCNLGRAAPNRTISASCSICRASLADSIIVLVCVADTRSTASGRGAIGTSGGATGTSSSIILEKSRGAVRTLALTGACDTTWVTLGAPIAAVNEVAVGTLSAYRVSRC